MRMNKKLSVLLGGVALAGAAVFTVSLTQAAPSIVTSRTPFQWPPFLGTLTQGSWPFEITIATATGSADLGSANLNVDYLAPAGQTYDIDKFGLTCLLASPGDVQLPNLTIDYVNTLYCSSLPLGNALVQASYSLKTP